MLKVSWLILPILACQAFPAGSQEAGDGQAGLAYAQEVCSGCHAVRREDPFSPVIEAPRFEDIANTPGMTGLALTVWFQSPHEFMPMIVMAPADKRDVTQYILSLKR